MTNHRFSENNFDLIRLLLALFVCIFHIYALSGFPELSIIGDIFSSLMAVKAFFVVSGFLIFMSYERSPSISSYSKKRILRIMPAYIATIALCAFGLFWVSSSSAQEFFSVLWVKYLVSNLAFMNFLGPNLPGVFEQNKIEAVNGSLWTLKIEVIFYILVPYLTFLFRKFGHTKVIVILYIFSVSYYSLFSLMHKQFNDNFYLQLSYQLPGQISYFVSGAYIYYNINFFKRNIIYFSIASIFILSINQNTPIPALEPFALAVVVIGLGTFTHSGNFCKYGDFSYGLYILHFPVIQIFLSKNWLASQPILFFFAIILTSLAGSFAMWHLIEKRFLRSDNHYIASAKGDTEAT